METKIEDLLRRCLATAGEEQTRSALEALLARIAEAAAVNVLTVIANAGVHKIPDRYLLGDVYEASYGNFEGQTHAAIVEEIKQILRALNEKLRQREWKKIYLIPTGHPVVAAQIKTFIYRVARINTVDLLYLNGSHFEVELDHRQVVLPGAEQ